MNRMCFCDFIKGYKKRMDRNKQFIHFVQPTNFVKTYSNEAYIRISVNALPVTDSVVSRQTSRNRFSRRHSCTNPVFLTNNGFEYCPCSARTRKSRRKRILASRKAGKTNNVCDSTNESDDTFDAKSDHCNIATKQVSQLNKTSQHPDDCIAVNTTYDPGNSEKVDQTDDKKTCSSERFVTNSIDNSSNGEQVTPEADNISQYSSDNSVFSYVQNRRRVSLLVDELLAKIYGERGRTLSSGGTDIVDTVDYSTDSSCNVVVKCNSLLRKKCSFSGIPEDKCKKWNDLMCARLMTKPLSELKLLKRTLETNVHHVGSQLIRQLKRKDLLLSRIDTQCDIITACLQAKSAKRSEDTKMHFSMKPNAGESGFRQWHSAMKMVAKLPGGIPHEFRKTLWLTLAERHIVSRNLNWQLIERTCFNDSSNPDDEELGVQIVKDLHRTGCSLFCGASGEQNQAVLKRVLLAYARWNKFVGYCQGFNMLAALILEVMDRCEFDSLKVMIYLIEGVLPESYFANSLRGLSVDMAVFRDLLRLKLPDLSKQLEQLQNGGNDIGNNYEPPLTNVFTMQWFLTLFCNCLPHLTVLRVWDLIFLEGNEVLLKTALAIWDTLSDRIMPVKSADEFYSIMGVLTREMLEFGLMDANCLIKTISIIELSELTELRERYIYNITPWSQVARRGLRLFYSDDDTDGDSEDEPYDKQLESAYGFLRAATKQGSQSIKSMSPSSILSPFAVEKDRMALDISALKKQYGKIKERQRQAQIIFTAACNTHGLMGSVVPATPPPSAINHLLFGKSIVPRASKMTSVPVSKAIQRLKDTSSSTTDDSHKNRGETVYWDKKKGNQIRGDATEGVLNKASSLSNNLGSDSSSYSSAESLNSTSTELCDEPESEDGSSACSSPGPRRAQLSEPRRSLDSQRILSALFTTTILNVSEPPSISEDDSAITNGQSQIESTKYASKDVAKSKSFCAGVSPRSSIKRRSLDFGITSDLRETLRSNPELESIKFEALEVLFASSTLESIKCDVDYKASDVKNYVDRGNVESVDGNKDKTERVERIEFQCDEDAQLVAESVADNVFCAFQCGDILDKTLNDSAASCFVSNENKTVGVNSVCNDELVNCKLEDSYFLFDENFPESDRTQTIVETDSSLFENRDIVTEFSDPNLFSHIAYCSEDGKHERVAEAGSIIDADLNFLNDGSDNTKFSDLTADLRIGIADYHNNHKSSNNSCFNEVNESTSDAQPVVDLDLDFYNSIYDKNNTVVEEPAADTGFHVKTERKDLNFAFLPDIVTDSDQGFFDVDCSKNGQKVEIEERSIMDTDIDFFQNNGGEKTEFSDSNGTLLYDTTRFPEKTEYCDATDLNISKNISYMTDFTYCDNIGSVTESNSVNKVEIGNTVEKAGKSYVDLSENEDRCVEISESRDTKSFDDRDFSFLESDPNTDISLSSDANHVLHNESPYLKNRSHDVPFHDLGALNCIDDGESKNNFQSENMTLIDEPCGSDAKIHRSTVADLWSINNAFSPSNDTAHSSSCSTNAVSDSTENNDLPISTTNSRDWNSDLISWQNENYVSSLDTLHRQSNDITEDNPQSNQFISEYSFDTKLQEPFSELYNIVKNEYSTKFQTEDFVDENQKTSSLDELKANSSKLNGSALKLDSEVETQRETDVNFVNDYRTNINDLAELHAQNGYEFSSLNEVSHVKYSEFSDLNRGYNLDAFTRTHNVQETTLHKSSVVADEDNKLDVDVSSCRVNDVNSHIINNIKTQMQLKKILEENKKVLHEVHQRNSFDFQDVKTNLESTVEIIPFQRRSPDLEHNLKWQSHNPILVRHLSMDNLCNWKSRLKTGFFSHHRKWISISIDNSDLLTDATSNYSYEITGERNAAFPNSGQRERIEKTENVLRKNALNSKEAKLNSSFLHMNFDIIPSGSKKNNPMKEYMNKKNALSQSINPSQELPTINFNPFPSRNISRPPKELGIKLGLYSYKPK